MTNNDPREDLTSIPRNRPAQRTKRPKAQREIILKLHQRDQAVAALPEPTGGDRWRRAEWQLIRQHGAAWSTSLLSPSGEAMPDRIRARYRKAFHELASEGLIVPFSEFGTRVSHAKLSERGTAFALALQKSADAKHAQAPQPEVKP